MSEEWTAEELIACLKMFKNTLIQNDGHHYMRDWEYQLLDEVVKFLGALKSE